jgi:hypothetical protein
MNTYQKENVWECSYPILRACLQASYVDDIAHVSSCVAINFDSALNCVSSCFLKYFLFKNILK